MSRLAFRLLGPLCVERDGRSIPLGGTAQRALLAALLIRPNQTVPVERLIEDLWGEDLPPRAVKRLQVAIARLRKALGPGDGPDASPLVTEARGYKLVLEPGQRDVDRLEQLLDEGRRALGGAEYGQAAAKLGEALSLWRGSPLADVAFEAFAQAEVARLEELRLAALEDRLEADLQLGRHHDVIPELERLVADQPLRERLRGQLMLALYRAGRHAHALQTYQQSRQLLSRELGLEPSTALRDLERAILTHDPALDPGPRPHAVRRGGGRGLHAHHPGELPSAPAPLIGRVQEIEQVGTLLARPDVRLVTLTGPGGVGKTRLAIEVAALLRDGFAGGVRFVSLASARAAEHVPAMACHAVGVVPDGGESERDALLGALAGPSLLLVLDNFEHVMGAVPLVADLIASSPDVTVLVTSRTALRLAAEYRYRVEPLPVSAGSGAGTGPEAQVADAQRLFIERALARDHTFGGADHDAEAITAICKRVDGLPLAIELAAARLPLFTPTEIAHGLEHDLSTLGPAPLDAPPRHQTLQATLDWSAKLLAEPEQALLGRLSAFAGGFTREAAEAVADASVEMLDTLLSNSLLVRPHRQEREPRLLMLETIREYSAERLRRTGAEAAVRDGHAAFFLSFARRGEEGLRGQDHRAWLWRLDDELPNLRAALGWHLSHGDAEPGLELASALGRYWELRGSYAEGIAFLEQALELGDADVGSDVAATALFTLGRLVALRHNDLERGRTQIAAAADAFRDLGDIRRLSWCIEALSNIDVRLSRYDEARPAALRALELARQTGDPWTIGLALKACASAGESMAEARHFCDEALPILRELGDEVLLIILLVNVGFRATISGEYAYASELLTEAAALASASTDVVGLAVSLGNLGNVALLQDRYAEAERVYRDALTVCRDHRVHMHACEPLAGLAAAAAAQGRWNRAAVLIGAARALRLGQPLTPVEQEMEERFLEPARVRSGAPSWDIAEREGRGLATDQALRVALEDE